MKRYLGKCLVVAAMMVFSMISWAQEPPHPNMGNPPNQGGTTNGPVGGGAPLGDGIPILITLVISIGVSRFAHLSRERKDIP
jgi:hypothetical protein